MLEAGKLTEEEGKILRSALSMYGSSLQRETHYYTQHGPREVASACRDDQAVALDMLMHVQWRLDLPLEKTR